MWKSKIDVPGAMQKVLTPMANNEPSPGIPSHRVHHDNLPPPPTGYCEMTQHPLKHLFLAAMELELSTLESKASTSACGLSRVDSTGAPIEAELFFGRGCRRGVCSHKVSTPGSSRPKHAGDGCITSRFRGGSSTETRNSHIPLQRHAS